MVGITAKFVPIFTDSIRNSLGTKLNTATRKAIEKRKPALLRLVSKYNTYCADIADSWPRGCNIPIPAPLPTETTALRNDPLLYQDLWIHPTASGVPRWMDDADVRDGIRSVHIVDHCVEEQARLKSECANMLGWLRNELQIVARALETLTGAICVLISILTHLLSDHNLVLALQQRQRRLQTLQIVWIPVLQFSEPAIVAPLPDTVSSSLRPPVGASASVADTSATAANLEHGIGDQAIAPVPDPISSSSQPPAGASASVADTSAAVQNLGQRIVTLTLETNEDLLDDEESFPAPLDFPVSSEELDPGTISDVEEPLMVEDMIAYDDSDDTSNIGFERDQLQLEISWDALVRTICR
jgi:hypothetical protein